MSCAGNTPHVRQFPVVAYFGGTRCECADARTARVWLTGMLAADPEQDRFGFFTRREADPAGPCWDSLHFLTGPDWCRACGTAADLEHMTHGPLCCACLDDFQTQTQTQTPTR